MNKINTVNFFFLLCVACFFIVGCTNETVDNGQSEYLISDSALSSQTTVSSETIEQIVKSVPSSLELASVIKSSGVQFNKSILNKTANSSRYINTYQKALNLGVYGADLAYINLYEKTYAGVDYLGTIQSLATELKLGHFFDFETLKRLSATNKNTDSIIHISSSSFEKMSDYLSKQKREKISILMLMGGWVESLHLLSQVATETNNQLLIDRVGEQKVALEQIMGLVDAIKEDEALVGLTKNMYALDKLYADVSIAYNDSEPITKEVDGMLVVESTTETTVQIPKDLFVKITEQVKQTREQIIMP